MMSDAPETIWWNNAPPPDTYISSTPFAGGIRYRIDTLELHSNAQVVDGEKCDCCGKIYHTIYRVDNDIWAKIAPKKGLLGEHPEHQFGGLLCVDCASKEAGAIGITLRFNGQVAWPTFPPATDAQIKANPKVQALVEKAKKADTLLLSYGMRPEFYRKASKALRAAIASLENPDG